MMSEILRVSVIIPAWNLWRMTEACLHSLARHTSGEDVEVLVVDNGSTDATATELEPLGRALFGAAFQPVRLAENMGFARGCNAGARAASGELLFFLNNDTTMTPGWLPPLRAAMADPRLGAVGPLLLYPDGAVQHCGIFVSPFCSLGHLYEFFPGTYAAARKKHPLQAITGAAVMLRRDAFWDCGGFHEAYCNGFEDVDLCLTLRARGLKVGVESAAVVHHHTSQTPGRFDHDLRNGQILLQRHEATLRPDLHILAAMDGCRLCIGPTGALWLSLADERQERMNARFGGERFRESVCRAALEKEPLWRDGWLMLAEYLEKAGQMLEALLVASRAALLFPEALVQMRLLRLARKTGDPADVQDAARLMQPEAAGAEQPAHVRIRRARRQAYDHGDMLLAGLLGDWLARYGQAGKAGLEEGGL